MTDDTSAVINTSLTERETRQPLFSIYHSQILVHTPSLTQAWSCCLATFKQLNLRGASNLKKTHVLGRILTASTTHNWKHRKPWPKLTLFFFPVLFYAFSVRFSSFQKSVLLEWTRVLKGMSRVPFGSLIYWIALFLAAASSPTLSPDASDRGTPKTIHVPAGGNSVNSHCCFPVWTYYSDFYPYSVRFF